MTMLHSKPIYWHPTGPLMRYENGALHIEDLNLLASGWAIVPVEATEEMWQAGAVRKEMGDGVESIYRAMIAASKERTANE